jgi:hypothetical protein
MFMNGLCPIVHRRPIGELMLVKRARRVFFDLDQLPDRNS